MDESTIPTESFLYISSSNCSCGQWIHGLGGYDSDGYRTDRLFQFRVGVIKYALGIGSV